MKKTKTENSISKQVGDYHIIKELAVDKEGNPKGGFGRIYLAEYLNLGEPACIKVNQVREDPAENRQLIEILWAEAKLLWKLDAHPSIPKVKAFMKVNDQQAAMAMEYIPEKTLEQLIREKGRLHPEDACFVTERLLGALYYCQNQGVVHTDVKPENIFVDPKERNIKLIDFGLAAYKPTEKTLPLGYTPRYAAPELLQEKPPLPQTDLYGAGMVLLFALGGDPDAKTLPRDVPEPITELCHRLLRYDPKQRPNWETENVIETLSDIRLAVFGRRHIR